MLLSISSILIISMSISILFATAPLTLGLWLIFMTLIASVFLSIMSSKWFAIILLLIYVGGLLVMFSYFSAISPNQLTDVATMLSTMLLSSTILLSIIMSGYSLSSSMTHNSIQEFSHMSILTSHSILPLMAAALILFFTMVTVIKIAPNHQGPLRPFN